MKPKSFNEYKLLRESEENKTNNETNPVGTKVSLGDGNKFVPFDISDDPKSELYGKNKNLAPVVRAFKQGANWGWSRDENTGGEKPVKITSKKLFLAGGAVRDHLLGKKPRDVELATNASPDEVYRLLKQNGFTYVNKNGESKNSKVSPNQKEGSQQTFWVIKENKNGRPYLFGIKVNEDEYTLQIFSKTPKGNVNKDFESGTQTDDASGRDFTINGMYILLNNDNGSNKDLYDFFGGMHHLSSGKINSIGDMSSKFEEDPSRILRYARMLSVYGNPDKVSDEDKEVVRNMSDKLKSVDRKYMMDEFKKGMDNEEIDPRKYLGVYRDLGLLNHIFPGKIIDADLPKEVSELGDRQIPLAFMLRMNDPSSLNDLGLDPKDCNKISFLIKSLDLDDNIDDDSLSNLTTSYLTSGLSGRKLRDYLIRLGGKDGGLIDGFLSYARQPRVRIYVQKDGQESLSDDFADLVDPFTGEIDQNEAEQRKRQLELDSFHKHLHFMRPN